MQLSRLFLLVLIAFSGWFTGCSPSQYVSLTKRIPKTVPVDSKNVVVFEKGYPRPANAESIGIIKITDSGFSLNCSYPEVVQLAKETTSKVGGNAMQILKHQTPDIWSTCHQIDVAMLYIPNFADYKPVKPSSIPHPDLEKIKANRKADYESMAAAKTDTAATIFIENQPEFPGGLNAMMKYLSSSVKYPETAIRDNISGRVIGTFIVDENGEITELKILESVREDIDQEFIRIVMAMPAWIPGFQNGKPVKVKFTLPVNFNTNRPLKRKKSQ